MRHTSKSRNKHVAKISCNKVIMEYLHLVSPSLTTLGSNIRVAGRMKIHKTERDKLYFERGIPEICDI